MIYFLFFNAFATSFQAIYVLDQEYPQNEPNVTYLKIKTPYMFNNSAIEDIRVKDTSGAIYKNICNIESLGAPEVITETNYNYMYTLKVTFDNENNYYSRCIYKFNGSVLYNNSPFLNLDIQNPKQIPSVSIMQKTINDNFTAALVFNHGSINNVVSNTTWSQKNISMKYTPKNSNTQYDVQYVAGDEIDLCNITLLNSSSAPGIIKEISTGSLVIQYNLMDTYGSSNGTISSDSGFLYTNKVNIIGYGNDTNNRYYVNCTRSEDNVTSVEANVLKLVLNEKIDRIKYSNYALKQLPTWNKLFNIQDAQSKFKEISINIINDNSTEILLKGGVISKLSFRRDLAIKNFFKTYLKELIDKDGVILSLGVDDNDSYNFAGFQLEKVVLKNIKVFPLGTFKDNFKLLILEAPLLEVVGKHAFYNCGSLRKLSLPNVEKLEDAFCRGCFSLGIFEGTKVTSVGNDAFYDNYSLNNVILGSPVGLTHTLGARAFVANTRLRNLLIPGVHTVGNNIFDNVALSYIFAPNIKRILFNPFDTNINENSPSEIGTTFFGYKVSGQTIFGVLSNFVLELPDVVRFMLRNTTVFSTPPSQNYQN